MLNLDKDLSLKFPNQILRLFKYLMKLKFEYIHPYAPERKKKGTNTDWIQLDHKGIREISRQLVHKCIPNGLGRDVPSNLLNIIADSGDVQERVYRWLPGSCASPK